MVVGLSALLPLLALSNVFVPSQSPQGLVDHFRHADTDRRWHPSQKSIAVAEQVVGEPHHQPVEREAAYYCLAMAGIATDRNTSLMVADVLKHRRSSEDAVESLTFALEAVYFKHCSSAALWYIASTWLDGAAGEMLAEVQGDVYERNRSRLAHVWMSLSASQRHEVAEGIALHFGDDASAVAADVHSRNHEVRALAKAIQKACREQASGRTLGVVLQGPRPAFEMEPGKGLSLSEVEAHLNKARSEWPRSPAR